MLLDRGQHVKSDVIGSFDTDTAMSLNMNANSFELILKNLYQDPASAIIRELSTNAYEANIDSGTDKKVLIQLPTLLNNDLIIKDFGNGLNYDEVMKYLNVLFSSSKSTERNSLGGFGLGSKSPLAVVDSFYLTSVKDGVEHSFIWIKEPGQVPTPIYNGATKTDKESGITVTVPLSTSTKLNTNTLHTVFNQAAKKALLGFMGNVEIVKDITKPYDQLEFITDKVLDSNIVLQQDGFTLIKTDSSNSSYWSKSYCKYLLIRVGTVTYPSPYSYDDLSIKNETFSKLVKDSDKYIVVLDLPPSTLDIPMSREYLESTDNNKQLIKTALQEFQNNIDKYFKSQNINLDVSAFDFHKAISLNNTSTVSSTHNNTGLEWKLVLPYSTVLKHDKYYIDTSNAIYKKFTNYPKDYFEETDYKDSSPIVLFENVLRVLFNKVGVRLYKSEDTKLSNSIYVDKNSTRNIILVPESISNARTITLIKFVEEKYNLTEGEDYFLFKNYKAIDGLLDTECVFIKDLFVKTVQSYSHTAKANVIDLTTYLDLETEYNDFKKSNTISSTTVKTTDKLVGIRSDLLSNLILNKVNDNKIYTNCDLSKVCKIINGKGVSVPLGKSYFTEKDIILISNETSLPIIVNSHLRSIPTTHI